VRSEGEREEGGRAGGGLGGVEGVLWEEADGA